jgi:hypothetical protein
MNIYKRYKYDLENQNASDIHDVVGSTPYIF